jgi:hypothetical protein
MHDQGEGGAADPSSAPMSMKAVAGLLHRTMHDWKAPNGVPGFLVVRALVGHAAGRNLNRFQK